MHQPVKGQCRGTFKHGVGFTFAPYAKHHLVSPQVSLGHVDDGAYIVLQVSVDGHDGIAPVSRPFQSGPQRMLVSHVVRQFQSLDIVILLCKLLNQFPGAVFAAIVDIKNTPLVDALLFFQLV